MRRSHLQMFELQTLGRVHKGAHMLWWDWTARRRLTLLAVIFTVAAMPWLLLGWLPDNWGAFAGGTAFLAIPQIIAWFLFVGLRTGRLPVRFGSEDRKETPTWFWIIAAMYLAILLLFAWMGIALVFDLPMLPM